MPALCMVAPFAQPVFETVELQAIAASEQAPTTQTSTMSSWSSVYCLLHVLTISYRGH